MYDLLTDRNGCANISVNEDGLIQAYFYGNDNYFNSQSTKIIRYIYSNVTIDKTEANVSVNINLSEKINETVILILNNVSYNITAVNGYFSFNFHNLSNGFYTIEMIMLNDSYLFKNKSFILNVDDNKNIGNISVVNDILFENIPFDVKTFNISYLEKEIIEVNFEKNITGKLIFKLSNNLTKVVDIENNHGCWIIDKLNSGKYTVEVNYLNELFNSFSVCKSFEVFKLNTSFKLDISQIADSNNVIIHLEFRELHEGNITIYVDKEKYIKSINESVIVLCLNNLSNGYHDLEILYDGDVNFKKFNFTKKFSIKPFKFNISNVVEDYDYCNEIKDTVNLNNMCTVSNKAKIKPVLYAKNMIVKKRKSFNFKVKLFNSNGKALKGKKIFFKFKGKTFHSKTNKNGIAKVLIKLKLKMGKYKIKTRYSKVSIINFIVVK